MQKMYHFISDQHTPELRLSKSAVIPSQTTQYLKSFQLEAAEYLYDKLCNKQEFCIFNDESGLGKTASIIALLSAIAVDKKTLIVVQNDEQQLVGWEFHFGVLTEFSVCTIQSSDNTTDSEHDVYLVKWSILRSIGDLSKLNFDYVIVDHRGLTLNNNFCTSMLIKHFEKKINIVISSVDVTSDVKLLHNVLRLGGRLEQKFRNFKSFEQKFRLPEAKEVFSKKIDLEVYYRQREILGEYIKEYRLRRYCHQFETNLPLVSPEKYKTNLQLWSNNNSNNTRSSDNMNAASSNDLRSTAGTEEIIECLMRIKHERQEAENMASTRHSPEVVDLSEEPIAMSPLVFESTDSDAECNKTSTGAASTRQNTQERKRRARKPKPTSTKKKKSEIVVISDSDCEVIVPSSKCWRRTQQSPPLERTRQAGKRSISNESSETMRRSSKSESESTSKQNKFQKVSVAIPKVIAPTVVSAATTTPPRQNSSFMSEGSRPQNEKHSDSKKKKTKSPQRQTHTPVGLLRETRSMQRLTRSADSRIKSKYMHSEQSLNIDTPKQTRKARRKPTTKKGETQQKSSRSNANDVSKTTTTVTVTAATKSPKPTRSGKLKGKTASPKTKSQKPKNNKTVTETESQLPLPCSLLPQSELEYMQCGQQMPPQLISETVNDVADAMHFRIPATPQSQQLLLLPITTSFFNETDVAVVPDAQITEIVVLSSSQEERSHSVLKGQSRRTRALKRRRNQRRLKEATPPVNDAQQPSSSFGALLAREVASRTQHIRSPDLFSNCSDMTPLAQAQQMPHNSDCTFEGFKIFGSEVKLFQQQHAKPKFTVAMKKKRDRSCLDILEQMFEPRGIEPAKKVSKPTTTVLPTYPLESQTRLQITSPPGAITQLRCTSVDDEDIFEITSNGEFGNRLRLNSSGNISPINATQKTQQQAKAAQNNKITNYLIGNASSGFTIAGTGGGVAGGGSGSGSVEDAALAPLLRKSPKSLKSTQSTKLTRWFATTAAGHQLKQTESVPPTPKGRATITPKSEVGSQMRRNGSSRRKRLELCK